ncbi:Hsp70 family protein [Nocardia donostiensis]|uniref:Molecular chaperone n=1 Tax=Nocardia donostiensis TaxID=1538463 RepID=A0A1W0AWR2_9NOCA|nr:Hsp70 family protein [Nocardia donostiensis]ONM46973.1 hypothetical protein B0T46_19885 [Nocardia donostiensis]OQS14655.1 hypothetical protein B0T36_14225 [Nocardia donostiensis]OQS18007.1 hypothetical protein B0T44_21775 [Nocardia donostiensis]
MVLVLGVSAGAGGARAVLTHSDQPHLDPIDRCHIPRRAGAGIAEPVCEAIRRMRAAAARRAELITGTAVTCRSRTHTDAVRAAAGRDRLIVVDEPLAQLRYLRFTGALPDTGSVILYDLGSSGLTITQIDCRTDSVLACTRSTVLGGDGYDTLLRWQLARGGVVPDQPTIRRHRETLSSAHVITALDPGTEERTVITRSDLAELCAAGLHHSVSLVRQIAGETGVDADAVVLLGGCTRSPGIRAELAESLGLPIVYDAEPEYVSARGAVLLAAERPAVGVRTTRIRKGARPVSAPTPVGKRKLIAAAAVTVGLGATVAGLLTLRDAPARPAEDGTAPTPMQIVGIPPGPWR